MSNKENPKFKGLLLQEGSPDTFSRKPTLPPHGANSKAFLPYSLPFNVRLCGMCVLSCAPLFETPWTVAHQAPLPMGFFQARILEGVSISYFRGNLLNSGIESISLLSPALEVDSLPVDLPGAAAAAKSLQSCPTLCSPIGGSPPGSAVPGIL